jgi:hypothetical protein
VRRRWLYERRVLPKGTTMIRTFLLLLDLLTNYQAVAALVRDVFTFGIANAGMVCLLSSLEVVRRSKLRRNDLTTSRA